WDWTNDGTWDTNWSTTPTAAHVYGTSGLHTAALQVQDVRGSNKTTHVVAADDLAPVTTATLSGTLGQNGWYTGNVTITLNATDARSGVAGTPVQFDGGPATNYTVPFLVSNVGTHTVQYHSIDVAGNIEPTNSFSVVNGTISDIALLSRAILNGTAGSSGWYISAVTVTLELVNGTSPPDSIGYRLDGGTWTAYAQPFLVTGDGVHSLDFNATNGAGLIEAIHHTV